MSSPVVVLVAALNDVASYALIAWQSTLYERCLGLTLEDYAPVLATLLPVAGIIGGEAQAAAAPDYSHMPEA